MRHAIFKITLFLSILLFAETCFQLYYNFTSSSVIFQLSPIKEAIYEFKPNSEEKRWETIIKTNSLGFRDYEYSPHKDNDRMRLFIVGDSIVMGSQIPFEDIFAKRLEYLLGAKFEVWNLGVSGYDSWKEAAVLKEKWIRYRPDIVFLAICLNDYDNSQVLYWNNWLGRLEYRDNSKAKYFNWLYFHSDFYRFVYDRLYLIKRKFQGRDMPLQRLTLSEQQKKQWEKPLKDIVDTCRNNNIKIIFLVFPLRQQVDKYQVSEPFLNSFCAKHKVPFIDMILYLRDEYFCDMLHLNKDGHQITAEVIKNFLFENRLSDKNFSLGQ